MLQQNTTTGQLCIPWRNVRFSPNNFRDVMMSGLVSQMTVTSIVYSTLCSGADQRKHQSSASLAFVNGIHRWPVNSPHKWPVTRKMFQFDDVIMTTKHNKAGCICIFINCTVVTPKHQNTVIILAAYATAPASPLETHFHTSDIHTWMAYKLIPNTMGTLQRTLPRL